MSTENSRIIPQGTISIDTYPVRFERDSYRSWCEDFGINVFIIPPVGLEHYFEMVHEERKSGSGGERAYMPCIVGRCWKPEMSYHNANLMAPPGTTEDSKFFALGLAVPRLKMNGYIGSKASPKGILLVSEEYIGGQEFYATPIEELLRLTQNKEAEFYGVIRGFSGGGKRCPRVWVDADSCSLLKPDIFEHNLEALKSIKDPKKHFWWNIE